MSKRSVKTDIMVVRGGNHMGTARKGGGEYLKKVFYFLKECMEMERVVYSENTKESKK